MGKLAVPDGRAADNASADRAGALKVTSTMVCALLAALLPSWRRGFGFGVSAPARPQRAMLAW
jgi:hypothetical protein